MIYIQRFLDQLKNLQSQNAKELTMSLNEANKLHMDITKLLVELKTNTETATSSESINIEMDGGSF
jgi:hypothetical protein|tara:strand:- start:964 stop:1161 length:198 start_codon:yes stop_codon:yes gene_type:complete